MFNFGFLYLGRNDRSRKTIFEINDLQQLPYPFTSRVSIPVNKPKLGKQLGNFVLNGMRYHSRSEAVCAVLMELFIPGYKIELGKTFQISIGEDTHGNQLSVDFLVNGVLFEYHPPHLKSHSYKNEKGLRAYIEKQRKRYRRCGKTPTTGAFKKVTEWYYQKRRVQIDCSSIHRGRKLIVAASPEEFYHRVIRRWGKGPFPTRDEFLELFEMMLSKVSLISPKMTFKSKRKRSYIKNKISNKYFSRQKRAKKKRAA
ncbi:MAG: hypothetical protein R3A13_11050 [Bdellovibrionota bacterium]